MAEAQTPLTALAWSGNFNCMKAFVLSESENYWSGFLLDKDCDSDIVRAFFPGTITEKKDDADTTVEARERCKTIVTSNEKDFIRCIKEAQKRDIGPRCEDCWGLVVLPNKDLQRKNALEKANIKNGLTFSGRVMPWKAIAYANLCIIVENEGRLRIAKFKRCKFCERDSPIKEDWYRKLPVF